VKPRILSATAITWLASRGVTVRMRYALLTVATAAAVALPVNGALADGPPGHFPTTSAIPAPIPAPTPARTGVAERARLAAARTEATAYQQYNAYAAVSPDSRLATVWRTVANVEYNDHWRSEVDALNYYSSENAPNLAILRALALQAAAADQARAATAPTAAARDTLRAVAAREADNAALLGQAQSALAGNGPMPVVKPGQVIPLVVTPRPRYSGAFYEALTNPSDSAFQAAAWLRVGYSQAAMTAVSTGRPDLALLLTGLGAQEQAETIPTLLNLAGYVNGVRANLRASIAGETEAIAMYSGYAKAAARAGATSAAADFREYTADETGHRRTFQTELRRLGGLD